MTHVVPFLGEDMLKENGGRYSKADNWKPHVVTDGNLITGQNPASAHTGANALLEAGADARCALITCISRNSMDHSIRPPVRAPQASPRRP